MLLLIVLFSLNTQCSTELTETDEKPLCVRAACEMSSVALEWSHAVCTAVVLVASKFGQTSTRQLESSVEKETVDNPASCCKCSCSFCLFVSSLLCKMS